MERQSSKTPGAIQGAAPLLGQHTRELLTELGYEDSRIETLLEADVLAETPVA